MMTSAPSKLIRNTENQWRLLGFIIALAEVIIIFCNNVDN